MSCNNINNTYIEYLFNNNNKSPESGQWSGCVVLAWFARCVRSQVVGIAASRRFAARRAGRDRAGRTRVRRCALTRLTANTKRKL
jgi:hypothetical protein